MAKVLEFQLQHQSNEHPGLISFRMDWLDLLAVQGTLELLVTLKLFFLINKAPTIFAKNWDHKANFHKWFDASCGTVFNFQNQTDFLKNKSGITWANNISVFVISLWIRFDFQKGKGHYWGDRIPSYTHSRFQESILWRGWLEKYSSLSSGTFRWTFAS